MRRKQGISLIVLVITIIVMVILAASVVVALNNTGIIERSNEAVINMDRGQVKNYASLIWSDMYLDGLRGSELVKSVSDKLIENGIDPNKYNIIISDNGIEDKENKIVPEGFIYTIASSGEELTEGMIIPNGCAGFDTIREVEGDYIYTLQQNGFYTLEEAKQYAKQYYIVELKKMGYTWEEFLNANSMTEQDAWNNLGLTEENFVPSETVIKGWAISEVADKTKTEYDKLYGELLGYDLISLDATFNGCTNLTSFEIPEGVTSMSETFKDCTNLVSIVLPSTLKRLENNVFENCTKLAAVTLPEGIEYLSSYVFSNCTSLTSMTIPASLNDIYSNTAFDGCTAIKEYIVAADNTAYTAVDGVLYTKDMLVLFDYPKAKDGEEYAIIDGVEEINNNVFKKCKNIKKVVIPDSVTSFGIDAFEECTALTAVTFGENSNFKYIGNSCFRNCTALQEFSIPKLVERIGPYAFDGCKVLTSIVIPEKVTTIGFGTFMNCNALKKITLPSGLTSIGNLAFRDSKLTNVYFCGTEEQWNAIEIGTYNTGLTSATRTYNYIVE